MEMIPRNASSFTIFSSDDEEKREPASILDLTFDCKLQPSNRNSLLMLGHDSSLGPFMATVDSWTLFPEGEQCLRLHVRNVKGSWIRLANPSKGYEGSVQDALIIASFLELAMSLKKTNPRVYLEQLMERNRSSRVKIKRVLGKYYDSVVKTFVQLPRAPLSLNGAPIITNMESLLKGGFFAKKKVTGNKRCLVESDPENGSDSEDYIPLAQRTWKHSPISNKDEDPSSWSGEDVEDRGEHEFQDVAEIYGDQSDLLGEIGDNDDEELGDSAFCAICDDGGHLLFCDGPCMRSFHASEQAALNSSESKCRSLGYTVEEVKEMGSWLCPNCTHRKHQCFICGKLGRSEGQDKEVFVCDVALCGRFYHPQCLAKWKEGENFNGMADMDAFIQSVKEGAEGFCCPAHKCRRCGEGEEEGGNDNSMKLGKCRRCPKAFHKVCLPKTISFESRGHEPIRAWEIGDEENPVKQLLIYCLRHDIKEHLSTPARNHLKWPEGSSLWKPKHIKDVIELSPLPEQVPEKVPKYFSVGQKRILGDDMETIEYVSTVEQTPQKRQKVSTGHILQKDHIVVKPDLLVKPDKSQSVTVGMNRVPTLLNRGAPVLEVTPVTKKDLNTKIIGAPAPKTIPIAREVQHNRIKQNQAGLTGMDNLVQASCVGEIPLEPVKYVEKGKDLKKIVKDTPIDRQRQRNRISYIMEQANRQITLDSVENHLVQNSCYGENRRKPIHHGELNSILYAAKKAVETIKNGGSKEDAKRLCPKELFIQMLRAEDMLRVHLAPLLHGFRYTSFGRHFTRIDKLKEVVDRIHPYIDSGDMNPFYFTKGDWLQNKGDDFLDGRKLIIGLNPPFGTRASLANKFIRHALEFKPKLLVLIVPPETMSFSDNYRDFKYELVWEDRDLLKGHAFYLPGSAENNEENLTQWNVVPPPLYLWSSGSFIKKHKHIAYASGHIGQSREDTLSHRLPRAPLLVFPPLPRHASFTREGDSELERRPAWNHHKSKARGGWLD